MRYLTAAIAAVLCVMPVISTAATNSVAPQRQLTATPRRARPAAMQPAMPDGQLEKAISARFAKSKISTHNFKVHVQGGVATIEGKSDVLQHKGVATRLAKNAGALKVVNKIEVSQAAKDKALHNLDSGRRRAQVKRSDTNARSTKRSS